MGFPELISAITPEAAPGEQQLHFVRKDNGVALCGMTGLLTDEDTPAAWWPMSERRAFNNMYAGCYPCHDRHREISEQWVADRRAATVPS
jgi:hypothetical protein